MSMVITVKAVVVEVKVTSLTTNLDTVALVIVDLMMVVMVAKDVMMSM